MGWGKDVAAGSQFMAEVGSEPWGNQQAPPGEALVRVGSFEVKRDSLGWKNPWAKVLATVAIGLFFSGMIKTSWMISYRQGYSALIPQQDQLRRYGPVYMAIQRTRMGPNVSFYRQNGKAIFSEEYFSIPLPDVLAMANEFSGRPVATLWVYNGNPSRRVWQIDVNNQRILDLKTAIFNYERDDADGYGNLWGSLIFAIWFVASMFEVDRIRPTP